METTSKNSVLAEAGQWWRAADFREMALITGLRQYEFNPDDGYQDFVDACNNYWKNLSREEKIKIWKNFN